MFRAADVLGVMLLNLLNLNIDAGPPGTESLTFGDGDETSQPNAMNKQGEWNTEYNYGRNYEHSEGQEWGTGFKNQYNSENIGQNRQQPELPRTEISQLISVTEEPWKHASGLPKWIAGQQESYALQPTMYKTDFQQKTGSEIKNWYNWPIKNLTWPNWVTMKGDHYRKQPAPWWGAGSQQTEKAPMVTWFSKHSAEYGLGGSRVDRKQPFWPGSVGWTGDLGNHDEVPPPLWTSKDSTGNCC